MKICAHENESLFSLSVSCVLHHLFPTKDYSVSTVSGNLTHGNVAYHRMSQDSWHAAFHWMAHDPWQRCLPSDGSWPVATLPTLDKIDCVMAAHALRISRLQRIHHAHSCFTNCLMNSWHVFNEAWIKKIFY